jgi:hypothetical protein
MLGGAHPNGQRVREEGEQAGTQPANQASKHAGSRAAARQTKHQKMLRRASQSASQPPCQLERQPTNQPGARRANEPSSPKSSQLPDEVANPATPASQPLGRISLCPSLVRSLASCVRVCVVFALFSLSLVFDDDGQGGECREASLSGIEGRLGHSSRHAVGLEVSPPARSTLSFCRQSWRGDAADTRIGTELARG